MFKNSTVVDYRYVMTFEVMQVNVNKKSKYFSDAD